MTEGSIQKGGFALNTDALDTIKASSVGLVCDVGDTTARVFFVGPAKCVDTPLSILRAVDVRQTGKGFHVKICNICHRLLPMEDFDKNQTDAGGNFTTRPSCQVCRKGIDGKSITSSEKRRMDAIKPANQTIFVCPICRKRSIVGVTANIVKDHSHKTGMGREWICDSCNTGLGRFKDDKNLLHNIINYLEKFDHGGAE